MNQERRRVVVTGIGMVTPVGNNVQDNWQSIVQGKSGIGALTKFDLPDFPVKIAGEVKDFNPDGVIEKKKCARWIPSFSMASWRLLRL